MVVASLACVVFIDLLPDSVVSVPKVYHVGRAECGGRPQIEIAALSMMNET